MRLMTWIGSAAIILALCGCGNRAAELFETAQFEEHQNNRAHAVKLYEEIERKYPGSEHARKAGDRLKTIREETGRQADR